MSYPPQKVYHQKLLRIKFNDMIFVVYVHNGELVILIEGIVWSAWIFSLVKSTISCTIFFLGGIVFGEPLFILDGGLDLAATSGWSLWWVFFLSLFVCFIFLFIYVHICID
jgi:hypothetical protein